MRYLISVSYDGSKLYGFERQPNKLTVQGELERVLSKIGKKEVLIKGAGRTDRGVHARDQKAHFDLDIDIKPEGLKRAMNSMLDSSVYVNYAKVVNDDFHARFDVSKKIYEYKINLGEYDPIINSFCYNYNRKLNVSAMKRAAKYLIGMHSYEAFTAGERESYNSIIYKIVFKKDKDILTIKFEGKSFYRYMVRNLVGALMIVGEGKEKPEVIRDMIKTRKKVKPYVTVPANGLFLMKVDY